MMNDVKKRGDGGENGRVATAPQTDDQLRAVLIKYLWREREVRLNSVYRIEDFLAELGEPITRTRIPKKLRR